MNHGKHVAIEVPAAMTVKECWELVDVSERTRRHCMMLENCCYDFFEISTLNMAQQGLFGEVYHVRKDLARYARCWISTAETVWITLSPWIRRHSMAVRLP